MMITVDGIVLNETNYGESSKILNILTKEYGLISVIAKGSRTMKSKLRAISMKLVYASFTIKYKETGLSTLIDGAIIDSFKYIMTDFSKMNYALYLIDITKSLLREGNFPDLLKDLSDSLIKINENYNAQIITIIYEIKLLKYLGVKPNFTECVNCSSKDILTFDLTLGGAVCKNCYQNTYLFLPNTLKLLNLFQNVDIKKITKLNITSKKVLEEMEMFIKEYYDTYTGIYLRSKDKFNTLINLK